MTTARRLRQVFGPDGRTVIVALDHGLIDGPIPGLVDPRATVAAVVEGGADAVLTSFGIATRFAEALGRAGLVLRCDGADSSLGSPGTGTTGLAFGVADALRAGADAVAVSAFPGSPDEAASMAALTETVGRARSWRVPVMAEMVPGGFDSAAELRTPDAVAHAARLAAEVGADFAKVPRCDDFARVVRSTFVPVVVLGGAKGGEEATLTAVRNALDAGGAGVAIGRNVFQADDPAAMTAALVALVHEDASVDAAVKLL